MFKDCMGRSYSQQRRCGQSIDINTLALPTDLGPPNVPSLVGNPCIGATGLYMPNSGGCTLPLSYYQHQATIKSAFGVTVPPQVGEALNFGFCIPQKNFIIFDHTGNRTSLFVSALGQHSATPKSAVLPEPTCKHENFSLPALEERSSWCGLGQYSISGMEKSVMHEDTEELDALLYSDDDMDEEEEVSTGHSPSLGNAIEVVCDNEEVVNMSPTKRKRADDEYSGSSLKDTAGSGKPGDFSDDDVNSSASSCIRGSTGDAAQPWISLSCGSYKRGKKEKIRETVDILRNIVPGSKGKDATVVIDEAINYLKSLKLKAITLGIGVLA